jgi:hypothetical protein
MNDLNHWITFVGHTVVGWEAYLPAPRGDVEPLLQFGISLVEAGRRHTVWDVQHIGGGLPFVAGEQSYETYLRRAVNDHGFVPRFPWRISDVGDSMLARLAFYRGDSIVEEVVDDVGVLLRELRPDHDRTVTRSAPPVEVQGKPIRVDSVKEVLVEITLPTDIWFPHVMGMEGEYTSELYDNSALAQLHTPRLNAFLREVRDKTLALGGRWEKQDVSGIAVNYLHQWDELGIHL